MHGILPFIILFFYYVAFAVLHAAFIKVSADLRGLGVVWRDVFKYALGLMAIMLIIRSIVLKLGLSVSTSEIIGFGLVLNLAVGGWFFSTRALTQQNEPAGWPAGIFISALAYVFLVVTITIANTITKN